MKIEIQSVADKGNIEKERLVLKVKSATDIGDYVVIQAGFSGGEVTAQAHNSYWFPYKSVSAGDLVVLYTKSGRDKTTQLRQGGRAYFFYWGLESAIWNRTDRAPVLLHAPQWISKTPAEV